MLLRLIMLVCLAGCVHRIEQGSTETTQAQTGVLAQMHPLVLAEMEPEAFVCGSFRDPLPELVEELPDGSAAPVAHKGPSPGLECARREFKRRHSFILQTSSCSMDSCFYSGWLYKAALGQVVLVSVDSFGPAERSTCPEARTRIPDHGWIACEGGWENKVPIP